jgi:hypothetical protein
MKNSKVAKAVVTVAAGVTMAVMVGRIMPVNLVSGHTGFSLTQVNGECCGIYQACECPDLTIVPK